MRCSEKLKKQKFLGSKNSAENKEEIVEIKENSENIFSLKWMRIMYVNNMNKNAFDIKSISMIIFFGGDLIDANSKVAN